MSRQRRNNHLDGITPVSDVAEEGAAASGTGLNLKLLKEKKINELAAIARDFQIESASSLRKQDLIFSILQAQAEQKGFIYGEGVLEILPDGFGFLRAPDYNYLPVPTISTSRRAKSA
jgi:transcription termination factor Rho